MRFPKHKHRDTATVNRLDASSVEIADASVTELPLALVLDTSSSMSGRPIEVVNETLIETQIEFQKDAFKYLVHVATITFGHEGVQLWRGNHKIGRNEDAFVPAEKWSPPKLRASGVTPLTEAVMLAVACVEREKERLKVARRNYNRPVIWLWSDGVPTDDQGQPTDAWRELVPKLSHSERKFRLYALYPHGIPPEGKAALDQLASAAWPLEQFAYKDVLPLLSASVETAGSDPHAQDDEIQRTYDEIIMGRQRRR